MFLRHRLIRSEDFEQCLAISRDRHLYSSEEARALLCLWQELIAPEASLHTAIEETCLDGSRRIVYFCFCIPIARSFVDRAYSGAQPPALSHEVFRAWQSGCSPILTVPQIGEANGSGGIDVFVIHSGWPGDLSPVENQAVVEKIAQWIPYVNGGYRLNELLIESYSDWEFGWSVSAAFSLRIDYAEFGWEIPKGYRDGVFGLNCAEAHERVGGPFSGLFKHAMPRFFFTEGERALLLHALSEQTDAEAAELLCVSPDTIKKRWASLFARIERVAPGLLPPAGGNDGSKGRGPEKRRLLLAYLSHNMEEVRPYSQP